MKKVELKIIYNITEEGFKSKHMQDLKNSVLSGEMKRELKSGSLEEHISNLKVTIEFK